MMLKILAFVFSVAVVCFIGWLAYKFTNGKKKVKRNEYI